MAGKGTGKILVVKIGAIGDVIMALPMLRRLRELYPKGQITVVCGNSVAPLIRFMGMVDKIIAVSEKDLYLGSFLERVLCISSVWKSLFMKVFDLVIIGHADPKYRILSLSCKARKRREFSRTSQKVWPVPGRHHTDEYIRLCDETNGPDMIKGTLPEIDFPIPECFNQVLVTKGYKGIVALAPGGAKNHLNDDALRRWPLPDYVELAKQLILSGYRVLITGGPGDRWVCGAFGGLATDMLVGETGLLELIALYKQCDVVVTHDSGPLHLAGLAGTRVIGLFGPTNPHEKMPRGPDSTFIWGGRNLACCPCYDGRNYGTCPSNRCLQEISVDNVLEIVRKHDGIFKTKHIRRIYNE